VLGLAIDVGLFKTHQKYMTGRAWNNQGGSNRDGFNFKPYKPKRKQNVPPFDELKESQITSFKIVKPKRPNPDYGEFGDAVWVFEFYEDDLDLKEPQITVPGIYEPRISTPAIPKADPEVSAENIFPYAIEDEYELIVKYPNDIVLTISSGQAYAARNQINDPKFDLAIVIKSSVSISIEGVPGTVGVVVLANSPQNPSYSLYNWLITKLAIATDYSAQNPDPVLSGLQFRDNTIQLPTTQFTSGANTYSLFYADGLQPKQICLNAINKLLYFQPSDIPDAIDDYRMWWVTYAGEVLPLCLNIDGEPILPIISIAFAPTSLQTIQAGSGNSFVIRISINTIQASIFVVKALLAGTADPAFYSTSGISTDGLGARFVSISIGAGFVDVSIQPLANPGETATKIVRMETIDDVLYNLDPSALFIEGTITPQDVIIDILYRFLFLFVDGGNLKLGGYNAVNSITNLIPVPTGTFDYDFFQPNRKVFYGLNTIEPSSVDWGDLKPYKDDAIDPTGYIQMYWRFTWIEFDTMANTALVKYRLKDGSTVQTPPIDFINTRLPSWVGSNTWASRLTTGFQNPSSGDVNDRAIFEAIGDKYYLFNKGVLNISSSDSQVGAFSRLRAFGGTRFGYYIRPFVGGFFYDSTYDLRYFNEEISIGQQNPHFDNLPDAVLTFQTDQALLTQLKFTLGSLLGGECSNLYSQKIEGTIANEIVSTSTENITPSVTIGAFGDGSAEYDFTIDVSNDLSIRGAVDVNLSGPEANRTDTEIYKSGYSKRTVLIANQQNLIKTETFPFVTGRTIDITKDNNLINSVYRYYCSPLAKNFSIEPIGQAVKLTNTHLDFDIPEIDNNVGDLVVNFAADSFVFKKKYVSELERTFVTSPAGGSTTAIDIVNEYTYAATPLWTYLNDSSLGFFTIITNSNITNVRSVSVNSSETSTIQTHYEKQHYSMYLAPNAPVNFSNPSFIQTESNTFFGLDFATAFRTNTQIDAIFYNVLSTYSHTITDLLTVDRVRVVFVGDGYFTPQNTVVAKAKTAEMGVAARLYKSRKSSTNFGIVENWAVLTSGRIELQSIVKSPIGMFTGTVENAMFFPGTY
jgi:hypothetical protein